jgi:putative methylase
MGFKSVRELTVVLQSLQDFSEPSIALEQYSTPPNIAADWIWEMAKRGEVAGKIFLDAASGPGVLGIAILLLGARKVFFLDKDAAVMHVCIQNYNKIKEEYELGSAEFVVEDISLFDQEVDVVVQNPPFGTKEKHIDKKFLERAFVVGKTVYSMHKFVTKSFVKAIAQDYGFEITDVFRYDFPIKSTFSFHKKPVKSIDVGLWRMEKR